MNHRLAFLVVALASAPASGQPRTLAPLGGAAGTAPLEVPGFRPAEHVVPVGARGPRPLVVVLHGNFDRPEWECAAWAPIVDRRAFVLCPRGIPRRDAPGLDRWEYGGRPAIVREVAAGRAALAERYPGYLDDGTDVYVGFSLGAFHLAPLARQSPDRYPRIVLVEGGLDGWSRPMIRRFVAGGGRKIGFVCGQVGCRRRADGLATLLDRAGAAGRVAFAPIGHAFHGPILPLAKDVFDWLVEDDPRFRP